MSSELMTEILVLIFASTTYKSLDMATFNATTPSGLPPVTNYMDIFSAKIPALLGLYSLDANRLMIWNVFNQLACRSQ